MDTLQFDMNTKFWLHTPLREQWKSRLGDMMKQMDTLIMEWGRQASSPFSPDADLAAQDAAGVLLRTGAFWFNNGILLPDETPSNWPFHLKDLELWTVREKAKRVGLDPNDAAGYVCNTGEAHEFCIRALRQEIRRSEPTAPVTLLASSAAHPGVRSAAEMLGLRLIQIPCGLLGEVNITALDAALSSITDAVIAAATWRNQLGGFDDIRGISTLLNAHRQRTGLPALLHLDAARCFDDVTTLSLGDRRRLDLPGLSLGTEDAGADKDMVKVATIAAGGVNINGMGSELVVALKPRALGAVCGQFIECVAGRDDTICGSRDALAGASMAIHEARFRVAGLRRMHKHCRRLCRAITNHLIAAGVAVRFDARGLDLIIEAKLASPLPTALFDRWGARRLSNGDALLQVTPWAGSASACQLLSDLGICQDRIRIDRSLRAMRLSTFEVPEWICNQLRQMTDTWRVRSVYSCGYPGNHTTLSVIGPFVGKMMATPNTPKAVAWTAKCEQELIRGTCAALSVDPADVTASFTSGSTASNRIGILTALSILPHATLYASSAAHYSVAKIVADHESLRSTAVVSVPTDSLGRMSPEAFAAYLSRDKRAATSANRTFRSILFATDGTTFTGATDDLPALHAAARHEGCCVDYVHLDGALNLGASMKNVTLGPPGCEPGDIRTNRRIVQSLSVSQHKFPGLSVAGQVLVWTPKESFVSSTLPGHSNQINRRAVLELWMYRQLMTEWDGEALYRECLATANSLRTRLNNIGVSTVFNEDSLITLIQRQPPWLIETFNLSAEGSWVHFITMPHVSRSIVDPFIAAVSHHWSALTQARQLLRQHIARLYRIQECDVVCDTLDSRDESLLSKVTSAFYGRKVDVTGARIESFRAEWLNSTLCFTVRTASGSILAAILCRTSSIRSLESCAVLLTNAPHTPNGDLIHNEAHILANLFTSFLFSHNVISTVKIPVEDITGIIIPSGQ